MVSWIGQGWRGKENYWKSTLSAMGRHPVRGAQAEHLDRRVPLYHKQLKSQQIITKPQEVAGDRPVETRLQ